MFISLSQYRGADTKQVDYRKVTSNYEALTNMEDVCEQVHS